MATWETVGESIHALNQIVGAYRYNFWADYTGSGKIKWTKDRTYTTEIAEIDPPQVKETNAYNYRIRVAGTGKLTIAGKTYDITPTTPYFLYNVTSLPAFKLIANSTSNSSVTVNVELFLERIPKSAVAILKGNLYVTNNYFESDIWYYWTSTGTYSVIKDLTTGKVDLLLEKLYIKGETTYYGNASFMQGSPACGYTSYSVGYGKPSPINRNIGFGLTEIPSNPRFELNTVMCNENVVFEDVGDKILPDGTLSVRLGFEIYNDHRRPYFTHIINAKFNTMPTITLNTANNATLYENDTFKIDGTASDSDVGDILNVYYRINGGTSRAIATGISTGAVIPFNEQLTFRGGVLYKGATAITSALAEGTAHRLEVWSEDNKGGKSTVAERTFYVVPNRAPTLTINPFMQQSGMIDNDKITFSGASSDPDGNDVKVAYKLNTNAAVQIHSGPAGAWSFDLSLGLLKDGENTIVVEVTDTYNFKSSKTIKLNKHANLTPLEQSVQRYKITPPSGAAQGVLLWVQRDERQTVTAEISMTTGSEQEQYVPMTLSNTAPSRDGKQIEDQFTFLAAADKENINVKFNISGTGPVTLISGVLS